MQASASTSLARAFSRWGWVGFWVQVTLGGMSILFMAYYLVFARSPAVSRSGFPFIEYLTIANLLVLLFTIFWSYRYTRLARRIIDPQQPLPDTHVIAATWTGVAASSIGMVLSMTVLVIEVAAMLFFFLRAPQGGIPVVQTGTQAAYWVSSVDMVSLMALTLTLFAELVVLLLSLWLLFRSTAAASPPTAPVDEPLLTPGPQV